MQLIKRLFPYVLAPILSVLAIVLITKSWRLDFNIPIFSYQNDAMFYLFVAKNIVDTGGFFTNPFIGLPHLTQPFSIYDFPIQSDLFNLLIVQLLSKFFHNPFAVVNYYFFITFALISLSSFAVLRHFKISNFVALGISVLYAFLPYHFLRGTWHLFLSNYAIIPLTIMVAIWITSDKIRAISINSKQQYSFDFNRYFFVAFLIAIFAANNGVYYAYYSIITFLFALLIRILKYDKVFDKSNVSPLLLCCTIFLCLVVLYLPTLRYQIENGVNFQVGIRSSSESEFFGLRLIDIFIPVQDHYLKYFAEIKVAFNQRLFGGNDFPERSSSSLGIIGATGFISLLIWVVGKNYSKNNSLIKKTIKRFGLEEQEDLINDLSALNIFSVFFALSGGFVILISLVIPTIRSHARFCVFIGFMSLFFIALIFDKIISKNQNRKRVYAQIAIFVVMILGIFDQVGAKNSDYPQTEKMKLEYFNHHNFISEIEKVMPDSSMIFVLPASGFPERDDYKSLLGYLHSKNLRWSYPAIAGREADKWQTQVTSMPLDDFINEIKNYGFSGVFLDRELYAARFGFQKEREIFNFMKLKSKSEPIISDDKQLIFFAI